MNAKFASLALCASLLLSGCASISRLADWEPKPQVAFVSAANRRQADAEIARFKRDARFPNIAVATGKSMLPYLHGTPNEILLQEAYLFQDVFPGLLASYEHPQIKGKLVHHVVIDVSPDGQYFRASGYGNRRSDAGWHHVTAIKFITRKVITVEGER